MSQLSKLFLYHKILVRPRIIQLLNIVNVASYFASALLIIALIFENGFIVSLEEVAIIDKVYQYIWLLFLSNMTLQIVLNFKEVRSKLNLLTCGGGVLLYLSLIPLLLPEPVNNGFLDALWLFLDSKLYKVTLLTIMAFLQLSSGIMSILSRRVNPSFIFCASFASIILIGTGLLMLPRSTYEGISFIDALFTSTSATCVTGLTSVDVATTFTTAGLFIIASLIQIGGIGVMTLTCFFALFFMGSASFKSQAMISDMVSSKSLNSLLSTLIYILGFTLIIEMVGAFILFVDIQGTMGMTLNEEIWFSIFHSISAFCNAGFSTLPQNLGNELLMSNHNLFFITISILVILGGIGFPILVNLFDSARCKLHELKAKYIDRSERVCHQPRLYNINTRIVLMMTTILVVVGTAIIAALEWNGAFADLPTWDKVVQSFFTAVCPRTAGFASVNLSLFSMQSLMLIMVLMVIGGGTQSTAGGLKVNVFAVVLLNLVAIIRGDESVTIHGRRLSHDSIRRSNATFILYLIFICLSLFTLSLLEPDAPIMSLFFETVSALSTVGSSLDLTPTLGSDSKSIVILLMFIGRVGVLTIIMSIIKQRERADKYKYPSDNIIIN